MIIQIFQRSSILINQYFLDTQYSKGALIVVCTLDNIWIFSSVGADYALHIHYIGKSASRFFKSWDT
jgi:hypothetical protein